MVIITKYIEKRKQRKVNRKTIEAMETVATSLKEQINILETVFGEMNAKYGISDEETPFIFNQFLFFRVAFKDIVHMCIQLVTVEDEYDANLLSRNLVVHLHDFMDTTKDFLGRKMRDDLSRLDEADYLKAELQLLKRVYKLVKDDIFGDLSDIRHNTVAHKDKNSLKLNRSIKNLSLDNINRACLQVWMLFGCIVNLHQSIFYAILAQRENEILKSKGSVSEEDRNNMIKPKSIYSLLKKMLLILQGVDDEIAEVVCELTPEGWKKLKELNEYLQNEKKIN